MSTHPRNGIEPVDPIVQAGTLSGTQSIQRAFSLLREIAGRNRAGARLSELAAATGLRRSTTHRIAQSLVAERMVMQDADTRRYFLGPMAYELGLAAAPRFDLRERCQEALTRIAEKTGDTVFLTARSGFDAVCIDRREGNFPIKAFTLEVGGRRPLGVGGGSLAILSGLPDEEMRLLVEHNGARLAEWDGLTPAGLIAQARRAQKLGYVVRDIHTVAGIRTIAMAIRNGAGVPFAAISVSAITSRMPERRQHELAAMLKEEIRDVERRLTS
jgi:DNA-binding IclR family transcriptional regulator